MGITQKLRDDHDVLMRLAGDFREFIRHPAPPSIMDLDHFRDEFSKQLLAHLTREDWLLYPSLLQSSDRLVAGTAQAFIDETGGLLATYKSWLARWPDKKAVQDWTIFGAETTDLLDALCHRIERENTELYTLVERDLFKAA